MEIEKVIISSLLIGNAINTIAFIDNNYKGGLYFMRTEIRQIIRSHGLGMERFGKLVGSSHNGILRYERGDDSLNEKTKRNIEIGLNVLVKYDIICPTLNNKDFYHSWYNGKYDLHDRNVAKFNRTFKELFAKEAELT